MAARLAAAAVRLGVDPEPVVASFLLGEARRFLLWRDERHRDYLHGARSAVILLEDALVADGDVAAAAAAVESVDAAVAIAAAELDAVAGERAAAILRAVPTPHSASDRLLESLVTASEPVRLAALAERLDHARHLHLRPPDEWPAFHATVVGAYAPVAERTHPALARRFANWCRAYDAPKSKFSQRSARHF